ncbi:MAG: hypothetical protein AB7V56_09030 [Candidatus Nitrosocosmicus sp.]
MGISEENFSLSKQSRRNCVIDYITKNPECNKEAVISYCTDKGEGSRVTLGDTIKELIKEGVLKDGKAKRNAKSHKLTVVTENVLITFPQDLDEVLVLFKNFVDTVYDLMKDEKEIRNRILNSLYESYMNESNCDRVLESLPLLPYIIIDIIDDIFNFYFIFILGRKITDPKYLSKIYAYYFGQLSRMYSYISTNPNDISIKSVFTKYPQEKNYLRSKKYDNFTRVCYAAYLCTYFGIENRLYQILDYVWIKHIESISLIYSDELNRIIYFDSIEYERRKLIPNLYPKISNLNVSIKHYEDDLLNKLHNGVNFFILLNKGLELDNILPPFKIRQS